MTLLMRYAGLRISDVVTLTREHIKGQHLVKRAVKNNKLIRVELPSSVLEAWRCCRFRKRRRRTTNGTLPATQPACGVS
jgi:hypothetical protein